MRWQVTRSHVSGVVYVVVLEVVDVSNRSTSGANTKSSHTRTVPRVVNVEHLYFGEVKVVSRWIRC